MTTMTKQDFEFIANTISKIAKDAERVRIANHFAQELKATNPRFNAETFLQACRTRD